MKNKINRICEYCGKHSSEDVTDILYYYNIEEGKRLGTCKTCARELSKMGVIRCVNAFNHHLGSTCELCGQKY